MNCGCISVLRIAGNLEPDVKWQTASEIMELPPGWITAGHLDSQHVEPRESRCMFHEHAKPVLVTTGGPKI